MTRLKFVGRIIGRNVRALCIVWSLWEELRKVILVHTRIDECTTCLFELIALRELHFKRISRHECNVHHQYISLMGSQSVRNDIFTKLGPKEFLFPHEQFVENPKIEKSENQKIKIWKIWKIRKIWKSEKNWFFEN